MIQVTQRGSSRGRICTQTHVSPKPTHCLHHDVTPPCIRLVLGALPKHFPSTFSFALHPGSVCVLWPRLDSEISDRAETAACLLMPLPSQTERPWESGLTAPLDFCSRQWLPGLSPRSYFLSRFLPPERGLRCF